MRAVWIGRRSVDDRKSLRWFEGCGCSSGRSQRFDASIAEPAIIEGEIAGCIDRLQVLRIYEIKGSLVDSGGLQDIKVSGEQREWNRASRIDARVLELAFDVKRDGDEAAGCRLGEVACPLIDADGADDLFGLGDLMHLGPGNGTAKEQCGEEKEAMGSVSHRAVIEIRRYL